MHICHAGFRSSEKDKNNLSKHKIQFLNDHFAYWHLLFPTPIVPNTNSVWKTNFSLSVIHFYNNWVQTAILNLNITYILLYQQCDVAYKFSASSTLCHDQQKFQKRLKKIFLGFCRSTVNTINSKWQKENLKQLWIFPEVTDLHL